MEIIYVSKGALLCIWVGTYLHTYFHAAARYEKKVGPLAKKIDNQKGVLTVSIFENNWKNSMEHNGVKIMLMTAQL